MYISGSYSVSSGSYRLILTNPTLKLEIPNHNPTQEPHSDAYYHIKGSITILMLILMIIIVCFCCCYYCSCQKENNTYPDRDILMKISI